MPTIARREMRGGMWEISIIILSSENLKKKVYQLKASVIYNIKLKCMSCIKSGTHLKIKINANKNLYVVQILKYFPKL